MGGKAMPDEKVLKRASMALYQICVAISEQHENFNCPVFADAECPGQCLDGNFQCGDMTPELWAAMLTRDKGHDQ